MDADLGDGLWLYWRSLIAMNIPGFASFADKRTDGIQLMQNAEQNLFSYALQVVMHLHIPGWKRER